VLKEEREKAKEYPLGKESPNLPRWQLDELTRHRWLRQRSSQSADPGKIIWTRTSKGAAMTELHGYWADVAVTEENKFAFTAYSKDSGREVVTWFDYETEQQAMDTAVDFIRDGKEPRAPIPEEQPKKFEPVKRGRLSREEIRQKTQEIIRESEREAAQEIKDLVSPLEAELVADMKELAAKTDLGYQKATVAYLAGQGDANYKRHMKHWYRQMNEILRDKSDPQAADKLRATLEEEYTSVTMSDWDKHQIAKLLRK
jgi:hypothetical protein